MFLEHSDVVLYILIFIVDFTNKNHSRICHKCENNEHHDKIPKGFCAFAYCFYFYYSSLFGTRGKKMVILRVKNLILTLDLKFRS